MTGGTALTATVYRLAMPPDPPLPQADMDDLVNWCYTIGADPGSITGITITEDPPAAPVTAIYWIGHPEGEPLQPMAPAVPDNVRTYFQPVTDPAA